MDMARFEKISGREAVRRLLDGEVLFDSPDTTIFLKPNPDELWTSNGIYQAAFELPFSVLINKEFYVKKPFDVRQAMRDNPDEWVGKFRDDIGAWYKVGFDSKQFRAISVGLKSNLSVAHRQGYGTELVYDYDLDRCVPLHEEHP